jgi:hypothetical protein
MAMIFGPDTTIRWSCREGDYLIWARFQGFFDARYKVADMWELRDGDFVTLTDRVPDLPQGFELHPLEVSGPLVPWMRNKLNQGYTLDVPLDGPNLWRVFAGDRVAWVGSRRPHVKEGLLEIATFRTDALVYGEPFDLTGGLPSFGQPSGPPSPRTHALFNAGWAAIVKAGVPTTVSADCQWRLG